MQREIFAGDGKTLWKKEKRPVFVESGEGAGNMPGDEGEAGHAGV